LVSRQEPNNDFAWKVISLRHVSLREMGWSRKPYEFQSPPRSKSKGEATYGAFRKHAFLASKFLPIFLNAKLRSMVFLRTCGLPRNQIAPEKILGCRSTKSRAKLLK
jgi:hypothetical protein